MKIFVTGGTGFIGSALVDFLTGHGHEVVVVSRSKSISGKPPRAGVTIVSGDTTRPGPWQEAAAQADGAINLAGASIFQRWTPEVKKQILESRTATTGNLVAALNRRPQPGRFLLSTSAVGYYGPHQDEELDEDSPPGQDFLAKVTQAWEKATAQAQGIRTVLMRFGIVLSADGGALGQMLPLFRWGLGGRIGHGRQWFSWIHRVDLLEAIKFFIDRPETAGPFNCTAPQPVRNAELAKTLGRVLQRPAILPAPGFMIKLVLGEFGSVLLEGQKVLPRNLLAAGFSFKFPSLDLALKDMLEG